MAEVAFKTIAELIVALFAVGVFILFVGGMLPGVKANSFCIISNTISALPIPSNLKPSLDQCSFAKDTKKQTLENNFDDAALYQYVSQCWKNNDEGRAGLTHECYELFIPSVSGTVDEKSFTDYMIGSGYCEGLPDNFLEADGLMSDCGDSNRIFWKIGNITGSDVTIVVKFNAFDHRIEVI